MAKFQQPAEFDFQKPVEWPAWRNRFERFAEISKVTREDGSYQVSTLLYTMGPQAEHIFKSFNLSEADAVVLKTVLEKFDSHFQPRRNIIHERALFNTRTQGATETVEMYVRSLHEMADKCDFGNKREEQLRDRLVVGLRDKIASRDLQLKENLTFSEAVTFARQAEAVKEQIGLQRPSTSSATSTSAVVEEARKHQWGARPKHGRPQRTPKSKNDDQLTTGCKYCGRKHAADRNACPARESKCHKCSKTGHFAVVCRQSTAGGTGKPKHKKVPEVVVREDLDWHIPEVVNTVTTQDDKPWLVKLQIEEQSVSFKIDSGADVSVITPETYRQLKQPTLTPARVHLRGAGGSSLECLGQLQTTIKRKGKAFDVPLYVVKGARCNLLSREASKKMNLIHLSIDESSLESPGVYGDIGLMKIAPVKIQLRPDAVPYCVFSPRRIPLPLVPSVRKELERMESAGVIRKITEATEWCAPMVPVVKPNKSIRICVDLKRLNTSILRERYILPTIDDILPQLQGATVFSTLDAASGFWAVPLDNTSQKLTTFITPYGRYCFKRLPFGISSAPEIFMRIMHDLLRDLPGVSLYMDDILIYGSTEEEHDERLQQVMNVIQQSGLRLNKKKCVFRRQEIEFLGHLVTSSGVRPSPSKVKAIQDMPAPKDVHSLRSTLGMLNYMAKFCPNLSGTITPMYDLLKSGKEFAWHSPQQQAFEHAKNLVSASPVLAYFDPAKPTIVSADASSYGLGAVILQEQGNKQIQPIAFASRTLTDAEKRYAQIEKECLASVWACEKFSHFLSGLSNFTLLTDHKPLVPLLMEKDLDQVPLRCQRLIIRMMRFNPTAQHVPGKSLIIADHLSRHPTPHTAEEEQQEQDVTAHINAVAVGAFSIPRMKEIVEMTNNDPELQQLKRVIMAGWPEYISDLPPALHKYFEHRHRLTTTGGIIMLDKRIYIPSPMRKIILDRIHDGHQGISKCRERARDSAFWIGINKDIQTRVQSCEHCMQHRSSQNREPLICSPLPERPWQRIAADFAEYKKENFLVVVDYYSRFIEIVKMSSTSAVATLKALMPLYARYGNPEEIVTDNGPQFSSEEFKDFHAKYDIIHTTSSPLYPQSNGEAESAVKIAKSILRQDDVMLGLQAHRATPIPSLGFSPAQLFFGRQIKSTLPIAKENLEPRWPPRDALQSREDQKKGKTREYYNAKHGARQLSDLLVGQRVWVADREEAGYVVGPADTPRSMLIQVAGRTIRRNRRHLRVLPPATPDEDTSQPVFPSPPMNDARPPVSLNAAPPTPPLSSSESPAPPPPPPPVSDGPSSTSSSGAPLPSVPDVLNAPEEHPPPVRMSSSGRHIRAPVKLNL